MITLEGHGIDNAPLDIFLAMIQCYIVEYQVCRSRISRLNHKVYAIKIRCQPVIGILVSCTDSFGISSFRISLFVDDLIDSV